MEVKDAIEASPPSSGWSRRCLSRHAGFWAATFTFLAGSPISPVRSSRCGVCHRTAARSRYEFRNRCCTGHARALGGNP